MKIHTSRLPGLLLIEPDVFTDARGFFLESWQKQRYLEAGIDVDFVQDNLSRSAQNVLRGLHFQCPDSQGKLVQVLEGEVFDVAVDIRRGSPTFGQWESVILSATNFRQFYLPPGFAHGFCVLSPSALFSYKCTTAYNPENELCLRWDDPDLNIEWPPGPPILSAKDSAGISLCDIPADRQPLYQAP